MIVFCFDTVILSLTDLFVGKLEICWYCRRESWRALVIQLLGGKFEGWLEGGNPVGHRVMLIRRPH